MRGWRSIALAFLCVHAEAATGEVTAIRAGTLVDPETGTARRDVVVLVEEGRFAAIGPDVAIPATATTIDLSGSVVLPRLIDAHTHLCADIHPHWDRSSSAPTW